MTKALYTECPKIHFTESIVIWLKPYTQSVPDFALLSSLSYDENTTNRVSQNSLYRVTIFSQIYILKTVVKQALLSVVKY